MTERIARFLAENRPDTPCLVVDLDVIAEAYDLLRWHMPLARVFYAVKANPAAQIVAMLQRKGANFDVASRGEIELSAGSLSPVPARNGPCHANLAALHRWRSSCCAEPAT